jgi:uncharacterized protein (TIGR02646 family)
VIFVDRSQVDEPSPLIRGGNSPAERDNQAAKRHYSQPTSRQRPFEFKAYRHQAVREALLRLFRNKCCYCESRIETGNYDIEQFRPKGGVVQSSGGLLPLHYWWLADDWHNLYIACRACNTAKGSRFPLLDESTRAPIEAGWDILAREQILLLDPCNPDVVGKLVFLDTGIVVSSDGRGQASIDILQLNRQSLVAQRQALAGQIHLLLDAAEEAGRTEASPLRQNFLTQFQSMMAPSAAYSAMSAQLIQAGLESRGLTLDPTAFPDADVERISKGSSSARVQAKAKADFAAFRKEKENYSLEANEGVENYLESFRQIHRITIRNLGPIARLDLRLPDSASVAEGQPPDQTAGEDQPIHAASWMMLLGENATGKSTILKAIALAMIGERYFNTVRDSADLELGELVRKGCETGEISIYITGASIPRRMIIQSTGSTVFSGRSAQTLILAYGSTRLLPRKAEPGAGYGEAYARVENLFNPFLPLVDAEKWLLETSDDQFADVARALRRLLDVDAHQFFERDADGIYMMERRKRVPLSKLSDGYQTVIALFADILQVVMSRWPTPGSAEGLVLLDEVGTHLHPAWKLKFVKSMRDFFPRIQVIATTHEPLCLRGLGDGEIAVVQRGPMGAIHLVEDLPSIRGMRIDQILTSEHFGLGSTLDPDLEALFSEYRRLLRKGSLSEVQLTRVRELQAIINKRQAVGNTERERLMLEAIDRFIAQRGQRLSAEEKAARSDDLNQQLESIWLESPAA